MIDIRWILQRTINNKHILLMQMEKLLLYYKSRGYTEFNEPRTMIYYTVGLFKR